MGKLNIYTCRECGGHIVTRDLCPGVTPASIGCEATMDCKGIMWSSFYRVWDQGMAASHVWYRPTSLTGLTDWERSHVERGGLLLREAAVDEQVFNPRWMEEIPPLPSEATIARIDDAVKQTVRRHPTRERVR